MSTRSPLKVALAGNPNAGKTSLFNALTGSRQHVGNYPGITVEKRWGSTTRSDASYDIVDLPGTYSLTAFSPEERVAREELLAGHHDVVVLVADSTALRRSMLLLVQVMQIGARPVLCLNMADEAKAAGQSLDIERLEELLGLPVVETAAHKGVGCVALLAAIDKAAQGPRAKAPPLSPELDRALDTLGHAMKVPDKLDAARPWLAARVLVGDEEIEGQLEARGTDLVLLREAAKEERERVEKSGAGDLSLALTNESFRYVETIVSKVVKSNVRPDARKRSARIDSLLAHKWLGLPIFAAVMFAIFKLTFDIGEYPMGWIESAQNALASWVSGFWADGSTSPLRSLIVDGMIAGVGAVVVFLPNILLLFFGLALLEDTGYMARAAFLMDRVMNRFGLHGKSFVPMLTGFGCSIPGIMATRTLENERDRLTTMLVLPLMSCSARMTIWMLLIPIFFPPEWRGEALWGIYTIGILLAFSVALLLRKTLLKGEEAPFVMELPPYRLPTANALLRKMSERAWIYLRKAGTIILGVSILLWFLSSYPKKIEFDVDARAAALELSQEEIDKERQGEALRHSISGRIGQAMEPLIEPMGFDWKLGTAMIGAFAAKEVFVSQVGIVYSMGEVDENDEDLRDQIADDYPPLVGFSLMLFLLIGTPCMATFAVTKRESGSWKWAFLQLGGLTALAFAVSTLFYQVGRLF